MKAQWNRLVVGEREIEREPFDEGFAIELELPDGNTMQLKWNTDEQGLSIRCTEGSLRIAPQVANSILVTANRDW
jgi:hypothetical protein